MAKYYGKIGYNVTTKTSPTVWEDSIIEKEVYGDVIILGRRLENSGKVNDDVNIINKISFIADPFAMNNIMSIKYATYLDVKWKVTEVSVEFPRLILTLGGVYNE